ncbi:helix-turn-helix transcriptional regulator [Aquimarina sp. 2304DJ70-9]|uniref:helix-turn-helix transcriptional regulator n=1 Tax=Aquimarina penaris TaxID=3231044 RepID=UPI0034632C02
MKILALHLSPFIVYASARGMNIDQIIDKKRLRKVFDKTDEYIESEDFYDVLQEIQSTLGIERLGVNTGNFCKLSSLGVVHQISLQCITMQEALYYLRDFIVMTFPIMTLEIQQTGNRTNIELDLKGETCGVKSIILECYLAIISREIQLMSVRSVDIHITIPSHNPLYPYGTTYVEKYILSFPAVELKAAIKRYQRLHFDYLIPQYLVLVSTIKDNRYLVGRVKTTLLQMATPELPGLNEVADIFCTTPRTLQRALAKEGMTFREILNELKKQISVLLLSHEPYMVKDISYLLGYSETAAFARAFHKWYGQTPSEYIRLKTF